jgi:hypothetical protein
MPNLDFQVEGAEPIPFAVAPLLVFKLRLSNADPDERIQTVALRCQIQIEATHRPYSARDKERLFELFGEPELWSRSLRTMLWTHTSVIVPPFTESSIVDLPVPCTYDFNVAAAKYFYILEEGEVPLNLLFSGTVFYLGDGGALQVTQISWDKEAKFRLPVQVWKDMMDIYYPNSSWLRLRKDVFDRLYEYKLRSGFTTWEDALDTLLCRNDDALAPMKKGVKQ